MNRKYRALQMSSRWKINSSKVQESAILLKYFRDPLILEQESATFPLKDQLVNILGCAGHKVSIAITQCCHDRVKPATDNM